MSNPATYEDVNLILRLYELRREEKLREARDWFIRSYKVKTMAEHHQLCPAGSDANTYFRMVVTYWEMVASFITSGVLNEELFFQSGMELLLCYERIRDVLPAIRREFGNPGLYGNLEAAAQKGIQILNQHHPEAYSAFSARVRG